MARFTIDTDQQFDRNGSVMAERNLQVPILRPK